MPRTKRSRILETVHEGARGLHAAGLLDDVTMHEFDALCLPPVKRYAPSEIRRIRLSQRVSQPVFAAYLNVTKSTITQWEQGQKRPRGTALKLLELIERKGLRALV
ncbi:MAG: DNA-binding transcriptional regulator [Alphaproteobacteria bacterium]|nr:DNA-binding transcriptional regulator [Alphaproteobacteria bacterium]